MTMTTHRSVRRQSSTTGPPPNPNRRDSVVADANEKIDDGGSSTAPAGTAAGDDDEILYGINETSTTTSYMDQDFQDSDMRNFHRKDDIDNNITTTLLGNTNAHYNYNYRNSSSGNYGNLVGGGCCSSQTSSSHYGTSATPPAAFHPIDLIHGCLVLAFIILNILLIYCFLTSYSHQRRLPYEESDRIAPRKQKRRKRQLEKELKYKVWGSGDDTIHVGCSTPSTAASSSSNNSETDLDEEEGGRMFTTKRLFRSARPRALRGGRGGRRRRRRRRGQQPLRQNDAGVVLESVMTHGEDEERQHEDNDDVVQIELDCDSPPLGVVQNDGEEEKEENDATTSSSDPELARPQKQNEVSLSISITHGELNNSCAGGSDSIEGEEEDAVVAIDIGTGDDHHGEENNRNTSALSSEISAATTSAVLDINNNSNDNESSHDDRDRDGDQASIACSSSSLSSSSSQAPSCTICMEEFVVGDYVCVPTNERCQHNFHMDCMKDWLLCHTRCPICREVYLDTKKGGTSASSPTSTTSVDSSEAASRRRSSSRRSFFSLTRTRLAPNAITATTRRNDASTTDDSSPVISGTIPPTTDPSFVLQQPSLSAPPMTTVATDPSASLDDIL